MSDSHCADRTPVESSFMIAEEWIELNRWLLETPAGRRYAAYMADRTLSQARKMVAQFIEMLDRTFEMAARALEWARLDLLPLEEHPLAVVSGFKGAPRSPALFLTEIQARAP